MNNIEATPTITTGQPQCCQADEGKNVRRTRDPMTSLNTSKKILPMIQRDPEIMLNTPPAVGIQRG
jgi:hypothetical protein